MKDLPVFDPQSNFWKMYPKFKSLSIYAELYKNDRSKAKYKSSTDMWAIVAFWEPESPYSNLEENPESALGQCRSLSRDLTGDDNWWYENEARLSIYREEYEKYKLTPALRSLKQWEKKLKERDEILNETSYIIGQTDNNGRLVGSNVEILDKMLSSSSKLWEMYFKIQEQLLAEGSGGTTRGNAEESASDLGKL